MKLILIYGRMNPIHEGHAQMLSRTYKRAQKEGAEFRVYMSKTQDSSLNPLSYRDKLRFVRLIVGVGPTWDDRPVTNIFELVQELSKEYTEIELVFGGDRFRIFKPLMEKYENTFSCPVFVTNFSDRDKYPYSATEMRRLAASGNYKDFMAKCPSSFTPTQKIQLFSLVSVGLTKSVDDRKQQPRRTIQHTESEE